MIVNNKNFIHRKPSGRKHRLARDEHGGPDAFARA
jgi:hypothetical protein